MEGMPSLQLMKPSTMEKIHVCSGKFLREEDWGIAPTRDHPTMRVTRWKLLICHRLVPIASSFRNLLRILYNREMIYICLLYTSDAADERSSVDLGGRRIIKKKKN